MPKVISRQPGWLSRKSAAHSLFDIDSSQNTQHRILANRGSEVFIADGKKIRGGDLASMKASWDAQQNHNDVDLDDEAAHFKVLEPRYIGEDILQLVPSPLNNSLLAIVTAHTIHVCNIPDSRLLSEPRDGGVRLRTQMLGPTVHITSASRIVRALWHPHGVGGHCLVTITADAVVRVWELNMQDRSTLEQPTLAIDLRKLQKASSAEDDVSARPLGRSSGISYDQIGMEVAGACFGGSGDAEELGWSSMTLWIAMSEGDVYTLCPLLPTKFQACSSLMSNLSATILAEQEDLEPGTKNTNVAEQVLWLSELDKDRPMEALRQNEFQTARWIYSRPKSFSPVPKLQGPFAITPGELELELSLADILAIAPRLRSEPQISQILDGVPAAIIYLLTEEATIYVCADIQGVSGQWLSSNPTSPSQQTQQYADHELIVLGGVDTASKAKDDRPLVTLPTLTLDISDRCGIHVAHSRGTSYVSAEQWVRSLEEEMIGETSAGVGLRLGLEAEQSRIQRHQIIILPDRGEHQPSSPLILNDSDLGYVAITLCGGLPYVAVLDSPATDQGYSTSDPAIKEEPDVETRAEESVRFSSRAAYQPSKVFSYDLAPLKDTLRRPPNVNSSLSKVAMNEQIRLSEAVLDVMTHAHRVLSDETHKLGLAVAEIFTRCGLMQAELKTQIRRAREISERIEKLSDDFEEEDDENESTQNGTRKLDTRLSTASEKQTALTERFEALRKKLGSVGRPLSGKEKTWISEVDRVARDIPLEDEEEPKDPEATSLEPPSKKQRNRVQRFKEVEALVQSLRMQTEATVQTADTQGHDGPATDSRPTSRAGSINGSLGSSGDLLATSRGLRVPSDMRKQRITAIVGQGGSLERQTTILDAVVNKLDRLVVQES